MKRRVLLSISMGLGIGLLVIIFQKELIRELILLPFSYLIYIGVLVYRSFDQQALWTSLVIVVVVLGWLSLKIRNSFSDLIIESNDELPLRIQVWKKRLEDVDRGRYLQWRFAQHMSSLVLNAISYRVGTSRDQVDEKIAEREIDLPEEIQDYLEAAHGFQVSTAMTKRKQFLAVPQPLDLSPEAIAEFLEEYLGMVE